MAQAPTLQDVAARAGVHRSTVSLALRDSRSISAGTREKVRRIAEELGYRANPLIAALMRSRRTGRRVKHVALAYVTCHPTRYGWRPPSHDRPDYFPGAEARAKELGYKLEHFWLAEPGMTPARFAQILTHRGISGLLIGRLPHGLGEIHLPWERFSAVALGLTLRNPDLNRVTEDAFASAMEAIGQCVARGYRRIGFAFPEPDDSPNMADRWLGAYLRFQMSLAPRERLPVCEYRPGMGHFGEWLRTQRPDALLTTCAGPMRDLLAGCGRKAAEDVKLVPLVSEKPASEAAGIYLDPGIVGGLAVDMVVGMMHRGETGLPVEPHHVLVPGRWIEGGAPRQGGRRRPLLSAVELF